MIPPPAPPGVRARPALAAAPRDGVLEHAGTGDALQAAATRLGVELSLAAGRPVTGELRGASTGTVPLRPSGVWFTLRSGAGPGILTLDRPVAVALADVLQGGPGAGADRAPSEIELHVLGTHLTRALRPVTSALAVLGVPALALGEPGRGVPAVQPARPMLRLDVALTIGQGATEVTGGAALLVPAPTRPAPGPAPATGAADPVDVLGDVPFEVTVVLPRARVTAATVAGLRPGAVVRTGHPLSEPVLGLVAEVPLFRAELGQHRGQHTVHITTLIKESSS